MVNDFRSTIKESHFKTLRAKYQIPDNIPLRLPYKSKKFYYVGVEGVGVYEQMLKAEQGFPLSTLQCHLLQYLGLAVTQISLNAWRVFLSVEILYGAMYSFLPRNPLLRLICETLDSNRGWKSRYFFMESDKWMCHPGGNEFMPVDKTWGIMPPFSMRPSTFSSLLFLIFHVILIVRLLLQLGTVHKFLLNSGVSWRKFSIKPS